MSRPCLRWISLHVILACVRHAKNPALSFPRVTAVREESRIFAP